MSEMLLTWPEIEIIAETHDAFMLYGPPGTGKTRLAIHAARPDGSPVYVVNATEETPASELRGFFVPAGGGEFKYMHGVYNNWWKTGGRLIIDEVGQLSQDAVSLTLAVLNDPSVAQMTLPNGETLRPSAGWRQVIGTTNAHPSDMLPALVERLFPNIYVDVPADGAIDALPASLREAARNAIFSGKRDSTASLRAWQSVAKLRASLVNAKGMNATDALNLAARAVWGEHAQALVDSISLCAAKS